MTAPSPDRLRPPSARSIRRWTATVTAARAGRGRRAVLGDLWYGTVMVAITVALVAGFAGTLGQAIPSGNGAVAGHGRPWELAALTLLAGAGAVLATAGRLGPVGLGGAAATWWLPLPVDRADLLRPVLLRTVAVAAGVGAVAAPAVVGAAGLVGAVPEVLVWAGVGAGSCAALVGGAAVAQARGGVVIAAGDTMVAVAPVLALAVTVTGTAPWAWTPGPWTPERWVPVAVACLAVGLAATAVAERRLGRLDGGELRARGTTGDLLTYATVSLDVRELGRALTMTGPGRSRRARSVALSPGGAGRALVTADLLLLVRDSRRMVQVLAASCVALLAWLHPALAAAPIRYGVLLLAGYLAASAAAGGARHAEMAPVLDRLLPASALATRAWRLAVPTLSATVWACAVFGGQALASGQTGWLWLGLGLAPTLGAAVLRSAYRPPVNWATPVVATPMGAVPAGAGAGMLRGPDLAMLASVPTGIALVTGAPTPVLALVQAAASAVGVAVAVGQARRRDG